MAETTIKTLSINGVEQVPDENGNVNLSLTGKVVDSEVNDGFELNLGTEKVDLKTTDLVFYSGTSVDIKNTFPDPHAIVIAKTMQGVTERQNSIMDKVVSALNQVNSKATVHNYGNGYISGACFTFINSECRKEFFTYGFMDKLEELGYKPNFAITPLYAEQGYAYNANSTRYDYFTMDQIRYLRDNGYCFCNHSYSNDRAIYDSYKVTEDDLMADFKKSVKWFEQNGIKTSAFVYPFGYKSLVCDFVKFYEDYAIGTDNGVNILDSNPFNFNITPIKLTNFTDVVGAINNAVMSKGWVIFDLQDFGKDESTVAYQMSMLDSIKSLDEQYDIRYLPLDAILNGKAKMFSMGTPTEFFLRKDGVLRATLDEQSVKGINSSLKFGDLSDEFRNGLYEFIKSSVLDIPATGIELFVNGLPQSEMTELQYGKTYTLSYVLMPENATVATNTVTLYLPEKSKPYASIEGNKLTINNNAHITYSDIDGTGENGLSVSYSKQEEATITVIANVTSSECYHIIRFNFTLKNA